MQIENSNELSDAKPDECDECFSTFWIEDEENQFDSEDIMDQLQGLQQNTLEQLVKNAKTKIWTTSSHEPIYKGDAESTLHNKRAYWNKAVSGFKKITNMFPLKNVEVPESHTENYDFIFDNIYNSSNDDDNFKLRVTEYLHTHKFTLRIAEFVKFIEDEVIPALVIEEKTTILHTTACEWLYRLGWQYKDHSKNIYFNGYEHEDIDELLFYAKDGAVKAWSSEDESQLRQKSQGLSICVSDFICESIRHFQLSEEECAINDSLPDDEWLIYTEVSKRAIPIFERTHLGKIDLFLFDNSCNYNAFADDALVVTRMNMKDSGKQPLLCNGQKPDGLTHFMTFTDIDGVVKLKGIRRVIHECRLWIPGMIRKYDVSKQNNPDPINLNCCATCILSAQPDFASQKSYLQEIIEAAGYMCKAAVFAVKQYQSHCHVPTSVLEKFGNVNQ
ncbi:9333_t:CDS:2 [Cetraspora pellucida]|uniref:9333_t:CDS:1 n=1 Tax=Cetraspora pellucida TaxID=1433469 RepID=A0A9N9NL96_9GLOM|nr:9333_t:CDS:2 [Cetraspora pellucida]